MPPDYARTRSQSRQVKCRVVILEPATFPPFLTNFTDLLLIRALLLVLQLILLLAYTFCPVPDAW